MRLSDQQRLHWLRLIRSENVGPATFRQLINRFGSAEEALARLPELAARGGARRIHRVTGEDEAKAELARAEACGARFVAIGEDDYPACLRAIDAPPPLLAVCGNAAPASARPVAIVGSRNASVAGVRIARRIAGDLGQADHGVVSGLARGIDRAAHEGSLDTGTVAVMAGGLDMPYPPENRELYKSIPESGGCAVSEMPFGHEPRARDFPRRNRLIAGIAIGLVVIEAAQRSGSLISARLANEMGRLVFAVPGSPLDPRAAGGNGLIRQGAVLIRDARDVMEALAPLDERMPPDALSEPADDDGDLAAAPPPDDRARALIAEALGPTPVHVDDIIRHTGLSAAEVALVLLELQLAGRLERHSGGAVSFLPIGP